jgi:hypothetical protein
MFITTFSRARKCFFFRAKRIYNSAVQHTNIWLLLTLYSHLHWGFQVVCFLRDFTLEISKDFSSVAKHLVSNPGQATPFWRRKSKRHLKVSFTKAEEQMFTIAACLHPKLAKTPQFLSFHLFPFSCDNCVFRFAKPGYSEVTVGGTQNYILTVLLGTKCIICWTNNFLSLCRV